MCMSTDLCGRGIWVCFEHVLDLLCPRDNRTLQDVDLILVLHAGLMAGHVWCGHGGLRRQGKQGLTLHLPNGHKHCGKGKQVG